MNIGPWNEPLTADSWRDSIAVLHIRKSALGFADGHVAMHRWKSKHTIYIGKKLNSGSAIQQKDLAPADLPDEDIEYMHTHSMVKKTWFR